MAIPKPRLTKLSKDFSKNMYQDEIKRCIFPGKFLLEGLCCWFDNESLLYKSMGWFLFWNLILVEIFHATYVFKNFKDIEDAATAGATVTTTMEAIVRVYALLKKRHLINSILVRIWKQFWPLDAVDPINKERFRKRAHLAMILVSLFLASSIISNSQMVALPYIKNRSMLMKSTFPFVWDKLYYYELVYVWHYFSDWSALFIINAFDFFFVGVVTICTIQFSILEEIFRSILSKESLRHRAVIFGEKGKSMDAKEMLLKCIEQHKLLIDICDDLEESFNVTVLMQLFVSTSAICAASLLIKVSYNQFLKKLTYASAHLSQLFYFCFVGNELSYESGQLSDAVYECNWHLSYDRDFRKALLLIIQRSQRVQWLTAVGMVKLDFATFLKIIRLSFSFYTLLQDLLMRNLDVI